MPESPKEGTGSHVLTTMKVQGVRKGLIESSTTTVGGLGSSIEVGFQENVRGLRLYPGSH